MSKVRFPFCSVSIFSLLVSLLAVTPMSLAQGTQELPSRYMDELNWVHFREIVPAKVRTVLLTTGTLEPHGVTANGADNLAPKKIAETIAGDPGINALIAPHIPYGVTGGMAPYPGATHIPEDVYEPYVRAVLLGLVRNGFQNIIVINGHGGPQTALLMKVSREISLAHEVNTLVVNWWSTCSKAAVEVFGNRGGHAGENETAFIQAINPKLVHPELLEKLAASPVPPPASWQATPFESSISMYERGKGFPGDFDQAKADEYFKQVTECVGHLVRGTLAKWRTVGFN